MYFLEFLSLMSYSYFLIPTPQLSSFTWVLTCSCLFTSHFTLPYDSLYYLFSSFFSLVHFHYPYPFPFPLLSALYLLLFLIKPFIFFCLNSLSFVSIIFFSLTFLICIVVGFFNHPFVCLCLFICFLLTDILRCTRMVALAVFCQLKKLMKRNYSNMKTSKKTLADLLNRDLLIN